MTTKRLSMFAALEVPDLDSTPSAGSKISIIKKAP